MFGDLGLHHPKALVRQVCCRPECRAGTGRSQSVLASSKAHAGLSRDSPPCQHPLTLESALHLQWRPRLCYALVYRPDMYVIQISQLHQSTAGACARMASQLGPVKSSKESGSVTCLLCKRAPGTDDQTVQRQRTCGHWTEQMQQQRSHRQRTGSSNVA